MIIIHEIGSYFLRNYVIETPLGFIAIDTGYPGGEKKFIKRFEKIAPLRELKYIFLTHAHDDHAGFLASLLEKTDATVVLNPLGISVLQNGENEVPPGAGYSTRLASTFGIFKKEFRFPPVELTDRAIYTADEKDQYFLHLGLPLRILFLPGHTKDSIGLFDESAKKIYAGDAAMNAVISRGKHTIWIDDVKAFGESWDKIISLDPKLIYPSHGNPFPLKYLKKFRNFMDGRELIEMKSIR